MDMNMDTSTMSMATTTASVAMSMTSSVVSSTASPSSAMSGSMDMDAMSSMAMTFFTSARTPLYSTTWTPINDGQYAGTCIFLIVLAAILRFILALRPILEAHVWNDGVRNNSHFLHDHARIEQQQTSGPVSNSFSNVKNDITSRWSEWRVNPAAGRATYELVIAGIAYLLMLAVMTMNHQYLHLDVAAGGLAKNAAYDIEKPEAIKRAMIEEFSTWHPYQLRQYILYAEGPVARPLYMLPVGWKWQSRPGLTLVGDAAHVMTPYAGEGVNLGLQDALKLSQAIIKAAAPTSIDDSALENEVKGFEDDMFVREKRTAECTLDIPKWTMFTEGSLGTVIEPVVLHILSFNMGPFASLFLYPIFVVVVCSFVYSRSSINQSARLA
ncbi:hypothetical protein UA08_03734 [Talaromyces atroroseus]|uniref:Copper transport protein n=1 Tax=Talaromyces atroroseus TaxID=1441469 RepID=A0A225AYU2_TALAT|nr:hypothetical protein UA08_03734 [Talaromyces atroroseus]OKL60879.1 hypothetical protein UA08_03734 [Talaromyces atroroseus]